MSTSTLLLLQRAQTTAYFNVASVVVLIHDWFLTIDSELAFIWNPRWNMGTLLYLLARYPAFLDTSVYLYSAVGLSIPLHVCGLVIAMSTWMFLLGIALSEAIMMICVWAMWGRRRKMAMFLIIMALAVIVASTLGLQLEYHTSAFMPLKNFPGCQNVTTGTGAQNKAFIDFTALAFLELVLFVLMLSKAVEHSRHHSSTFVLECFRHGLIYYAVLSVLSVINLAVIIGGSQNSDDALLSIQRTFHAILSARMLLHLKRSTHQARGGSTTSTALGDEIVFRAESNTSGDSGSDRGRMSVI